MFHVEHLLPSPHDVRFLAQSLGLELSPAGLEWTLAHCRLLAEWSPRMSLVRAGSAAELLSRHVGEGWVAAQLLPDRSALEVLDVGSGAGFPGLPLRAMRPDVRLTLLEPRAKRAAFLRAVARETGSPQPRVVESTLEALPPGETFDVVTLRALSLPPERLLEHLRPDGILIAFPGTSESVTASWDDAGLRLLQELPLPTGPLMAQAWTRA